MQNEEGTGMNKNELISAVAAKADMTKESAGNAVDACFDSITEALAAGDEVGGQRNVERCTMGEHVSAAQTGETIWEMPANATHSHQRHPRQVRGTGQHKTGVSSIISRFTVLQ